MAENKKINASKENARRAKELFHKIQYGGSLTTEEAGFIEQFLDRTIGRLPAEESYAKERERGAKKRAKAKQEKASTKKETQPTPQPEEPAEKTTETS